MGLRAAASMATAGRWLARIVRLAGRVLAAVIVAGILLVLLNANPSNGVVSSIHDAAHSLVGSFDGMFKLKDARTELALNWGLAALVYLIAASLIARLIVLMGTAGLRLRRGFGRPGRRGRYA